MQELEQEKKRVCLFINVDWFALSHFSDYLKKLVSKGFAVTVLTTNTGKCDELRSLGLTVIELDLDRNYTNIFRELAAFIKIFLIFRKITPDNLDIILL